MIFDAHTDVLFDVINENHKFDYHLQEMDQYNGAILNYYFKGNESHNSFLFVLEKIKQFYEQNADILKDRHFILGVEGLGPLRELNDINYLLKAHIKIVTLTWNDANLLATGTYTNKERGLTDFGKQVLDALFLNNVIVDLSHLNYKSFWDVINYYQGLMIVSHSNVWALKQDERNLDDAQLEIIKKKKLLVGVNSYKKFVGQQEDLNSFGRIIDYLKAKIGIDHICLGLDFDYYLPSTTRTDSIKGLQFPHDLNNLKKWLICHNYNEEDIQKIFYKNIELWFKSSLIL